MEEDEDEEEIEEDAGASASSSVSLMEISHFLIVLIYACDATSDHIKKLLLFPFFPSVPNSIPAFEDYSIAEILFFVQTHFQHKHKLQSPSRRPFRQELNQNCS